MAEGRIAVVLPPGCSFDRIRPNSIETVVRTHLEASQFASDTCIFCDQSEDGQGPEPGISRLPAYRHRRSRTAALVTALRAWQPDLVEYHQHMISAAACARALAPIPTVLYRHNFVKHPGKLAHRWNYRRRLRAFSRFLFVSDATREDFTGNWPDFAACTATVPNSVKLPLWQASPETKERLISYVGRAAEDKGLMEFCAGLRPALEAEPSWRAVVIVGAWQDADPWVEEALRPLRSLPERVTILANQPIAAVRNWMKRVAIAVVPSLCREAFGLTAIEAHAAGAAVISSGRGGLREASGESALYLDRVESTDIDHALRRLMSDSSLRLNLAAMGQVHVQRHVEAGFAARRLDAFRTAAMEKAARPQSVFLGDLIAMEK